MTSIPRETKGANVDPDVAGSTLPDHGSTRLRVRYAETDQMGVAYHTHYLVWCEVGRTDLMRKLGAPYTELERQGLRLAVVEARVRYHAGARYDDEVRVDTRVARVQSRSVTFHYEIRRTAPGPELRLASAETKLMALDADGSPRSLPRALIDRLASSASRP